jgi:serine acetyltransferase
MRDACAIPRPGPRAILEMLKRDLEANAPSLKQGWGGRNILIAAASDLLSLRVTAVTLFRLAQLAGYVSHLLASMIKQFNQLVTGADISWRATIRGGLVLRHPIGVVIGEHTDIGERLIVQQGITVGGGMARIGSDCHLGAGSRIIGPVAIGNWVSVGANAVVIRDAEDFSLLVGVPASVKSCDRESAERRIEDAR